MRGGSATAPRSVAQLLARLAQLLLGLLRVPRSRVQVLVAEKLGQGHRVVAGVGEELVGHRVPQQVWVNVVATDGGVLVAQVADAPVGQRSPFADEDDLRLDRRSGIEV